MHLVLRRVFLEDQKSITSGAYGYICNGDIARKCDSNFKDCKQLIKEEMDNSLLLAIGGFSAIIAGSIYAMSTIGSGNGTAPKLKSDVNSIENIEASKYVLHNWEKTPILGNSGTADPERAKLTVKCNDRITQETYLGRNNISYNDKIYSSDCPHERFSSQEKCIESTIQCLCKK